jgi:ribosomal protein S1
VDIGVGRDGLVHISEMADGHVDRPSDVVQEGEEIEVRVVAVDHRKRRIELSLLNLPGEDTEIEAEDDQESPLTAMELAWQQAMKDQGMSVEVPARKRGSRQKKADIRRQQAEIIARTLKRQES